MVGDGSDAALAYHEPPIATILNLTGFLVALNVVNVCLDKLLYCGLIGQLFIGILWGTPGAKWLDPETEAVIQQLGYLGLIMLVYEGGLSTSIKSVRANLFVSIGVAITGIGAPMGLSFILKELVAASPLQAFAAGAALSATSLGTTFTILSSTNLIATRLGTVVTSAAMLDDVVGLVMVQIISNLGDDDSSFNAVTVIRPIFVSIGFAVGLFSLSAFCLKPIFKKVLVVKNKLPNFMGTIQFVFLSQTFCLLGIVAGAAYAGTSSLFAAYLAGVIVSWFDGLVAESKELDGSAPSNVHQPGSSTSNRNLPGKSTRNHGKQPQTQSLSETSTKQSSLLYDETPTGEKVYEKYYKEPVNRILIPFFFASIGFAIPITEMFQGSTVWRGVIYALLMTFGKMITGLWLVRFSLNPTPILITWVKKSFTYVHFCIPTKTNNRKQKKKQNISEDRIRSSKECTEISSSNQTCANERDKNAGASPDGNFSSQLVPQEGSQAPPSNPSPTITISPKPKSLYPPSILGLAMVARGEVGYLIASLAQSRGMFARGPSGERSEIYLAIIWAISICTLIGPVSVGTLVKRVKKLQLARGDSGLDPLGVWGI
ncbi:cation:proton antiporter [Aspergillus tanneri]|uniref:Cation/H+ exchanger transmembrane domain-containing protein n=1 Tax=Aspergillus tanneri TaxID=1220188 RepID=A0A5M9MN35_9EURO|nr:uncharacterized protein ATNIH1004_007781 [Aspergillus tanneri]KAA8646353.1 hypothetical protein ATNIH1004_007781 [Aspergillus tanneri]